MPSSLLQQLQRGVALEALGESGCSFTAESVFRETASMGAGLGAEGCQWALTQKRTLWGSGLRQGGDLRLLEDGSESGGALVSDVVAPNTASEGQDGDGERVRVSMGADRKTNALVREGPAYLSDCSVELPLRPSARAAAPLGPSSLSCRLRAWWRQVVRHVKGR